LGFSSLPLTRVVLFAIIYKLKNPLICRQTSYFSKRLVGVLDKMGILAPAGVYLFKTPNLPLTGSVAYRLVGFLFYIPKTLLISSKEVIPNKTFIIPSSINFGKSIFLIS